MTIFKDLFCLRGGFPRYPEFFYIFTQWSGSALVSMWETPHSNPWHLSQKSGALPMSHWNSKWEAGKEWQKIKIKLSSCTGKMFEQHEHCEKTKRVFKEQSKEKKSNLKQNSFSLLKCETFSFSLEKWFFPKIKSLDVWTKTHFFNMPFYAFIQNKN